MHCCCGSYRCSRESCRITSKRSVNQDFRLRGFPQGFAYSHEEAKDIIFLDNLQVQHTHVVKDNAVVNNQVLIFNASYSSHLNPIERLWAVAKRQFIKDCVTDANFKLQEEVKALVMKCILEASSVTLEKHVYACLKIMKNDVNTLRSL